jgi:hypothetical protein
LGLIIALPLSVGGGDIGGEDNTGPDITEGVFDIVLLGELGKNIVEDCCCCCCCSLGEVTGGTDDKVGIFVGVVGVIVLLLEDTTENLVASVGT